jgi:DNA-binding MarR family transcriptional regulator
MDNRLYFLLTRTENAASIYIKQRLGKAGLKVTPGQLSILFLLKNRDMQTMGELSIELETDNSAITRSIDRLEKSGLVIRKMNINDRREINISITEAGLHETENAIIVIADINKEIEMEFSAEELNTFKKNLLRMTALFREKEAE